MRDIILELKKNMSVHDYIKEHKEVWDIFKKEYFIGDPDEHFEADVEAIFAFGYLIGLSERMAKVADIEDEEEVEIVFQKRNE